LGGKTFNVAISRQGDGLVPIAVALYDIQRADAD